VDNPEFTSSGRADQIEIDRRRANAVRDFDNDLDRCVDDLTFEFDKVVGYAIRDAAGDDQNARANAFFTATQRIERIVLEHGRAIHLASRAFLQVLP
jgi:hypothetical protein